MKPGRELDALVAERVMGWKRMSYHETQPTNRYYADRHELTFYWYDADGKEVAPAEWSDCIDCGTIFPEWSPSTDIAAAWEVIAKFGRFDLTLGADGKWCAMFLGSPDRSFADTAPHAICLAALKAMGVEV